MMGRIFVVIIECDARLGAAMQFDDVRNWVLRNTDRSVLPHSAGVCNAADCCRDTNFIFDGEWMSAMVSTLMSVYTPLEIVLSIQLSTGKFDWQ